MMIGKQLAAKKSHWPYLALPAITLLLVTTAAATAFATAPSQHTWLQAKFSHASLRQPAPQGGRPIIADEIEEKRPNKEEGNGSKREEENRSRRGRDNAPRPPAMLNVTFMTGMAEAEIFVRANSGRLRSLGKTGANGRLTTKMPRGVYNITASRAGYQVQRQQIDVRPGRNTFILNLTGQPLAPGVNPNGTPSSAEEIIKRFLNPKQTDSVTASDWQRVQSQTAVAFAHNPSDSRVKAQTLFAQGQLAYLRGDYPNALVAFNNSALALPTSGLAYYGLGNAYLATNQLAEATQAYQRAIELSGGMPMAYKGMGDALSRQGKSKEALTYYERARALGYSSTNASLSAARNLMKMKRWTEALKQFEEISKTQPSADVFINIGDCYVELEQPLSAAPAYRRAMQLDPRSALAHAKYGEVMLDSREYAAAMEALERALALDPSGYYINRARARKLANQAAEKMRKM